MAEQRATEKEVNWGRWRQDLLAAGWSSGYIDGLFDAIRYYLLTVPDNG